MESKKPCSVKAVTKPHAGPEEVGGPDEVRETSSELCVREMQGTSMSSAYQLQRMLSSATAGVPEEHTVGKVKKDADVVETGRVMPHFHILFV